MFQFSLARGFVYMLGVSASIGVVLFAFRPGMGVVILAVPVTALWTYLAALVVEMVVEKKE